MIKEQVRLDIEMDSIVVLILFFFFFQAEDGIRDYKVTGVQTCALPISRFRDETGQVDLESMTELEKQIQFPLKIFNPVVLKKEGKTSFEEGCLSVPGYMEDVQRANYVELEYLNVAGEKTVIKSDGLLAI